MQKQRVAVERTLLDTTDHIKTVLTQRVYAALAEAGVTDRQKTIKILTVINAAVDETYTRFSRPFDKAVDDLVTAAQEAAVSRKTATKSAK